MELILFGLLIWSGVHLLPAVGAPLRTRLIGKLGEGPYKGIFSVLLIIAIYLMVTGWKASTPSHLYLSPQLLQTCALLLMAFGFMCFGSAIVPGKINQIIRHPQLTWVVLWSVAHLLTNGDSRSLLLFGGMGLWAILEMIFINKRDGAWTKPETPTGLKSILGAVIGLAVFIVVLFLHPYVSGVGLV